MQLFLPPLTVHGSNTSGSTSGSGAVGVLSADAVALCRAHWIRTLLAPAVDLILNSQALHMQILGRGLPPASSASSASATTASASPSSSSAPSVPPPVSLAAPASASSAASAPDDGTALLLRPLSVDERARIVKELSAGTVVAQRLGELATAVRSAKATLRSAANNNSSSSSSSSSSQANNSGSSSQGQGSQSSQSASNPCADLAATLEEAAAACELPLRPWSKKREKALLFEARKALLSQARVATDPEHVLLTVLLILHSTLRHVWWGVGCGCGSDDDEGES
jgi:hypothetical protein